MTSEEGRTRGRKPSRKRAGLQNGSSWGRARDGRARRDVGPATTKGQARQETGSRVRHRLRSVVWSRVGQWVVGACRASTEPEAEATAEAEAEAAADAELECPSQHADHPQRTPTRPEQPDIALTLRVCAGAAGGGLTARARAGGHKVSNFRFV